jgi:hypothetical protein
MSDGDGDRASRLRNRRNKTREKAQSKTDKTDKPVKQEKTAKQSKPSKPSEAAKADKAEKTSVKDDRPAQMMYLPESIQREMNRQFGLLETDFEYEFGEDFEKNRHYFPLLVKAGLDSLDKLDVQEIKDKIDEFDG